MTLMENQITATYDQDSKRYHRFLIDPGQGITGTIYIPKDMKIPDSVTIHFRTKANGQKEG
jgi:hypothetical protein